MKDMQIESAKQQINLLRYIEQTTGAEAKRQSDYFVMNPCPFCGRKDHFVIKPSQQYYHTFAVCGKSGTIVDFLIEYEGLTLHEAMKKTLSLAGMDSQYIAANDQSFPLKHLQLKTMNEYKDCSVNSTTADYDFTKLVEIAHASVGKTSYFQDRGLTDKTIRAYKLGYSETGLNVAQEFYDQMRGNSTFLALYKIILPVWSNDGKCHYFIPRLDESSVPSHFSVMPIKTYNLQGIPVSIFNSRYLEKCESNIIFITEGIFDALSIEEFDYPCMALNGTSNANKLFEQLTVQLDLQSNTSFVLIPDNDDAGQKLIQKFQEKFDELGLSLCVMNVPQQYKDANQYLMNNREGLEKLINQTVLEIEQHKKSKEGFVSEYLDTFLNEVMGNRVRPISTGFEELDSKLSGGLIPGLYVIGAISSLGKTTFVHQMADAIAGHRIPVLFFSLEMSKKEMISKSISRQTFSMNEKNAYSAIEIMKGEVPRETLEEAINVYFKTGDFLKIDEGSIQTDVIKMREQVKAFKEQYDRFVVFLDYLQIIQDPSKSNMGDKQTVEYNIAQLKLISRDFDVPVIVVSSFNRNNYNQTAGFESFKESGGIEYSADVVMALQLNNMSQLAQQKDETTRRDSIHEAKAKPIRKIEVVILKQRNGISWAKVDFAYHAKFNYFRCVPA
jgi:replicative DNA helicase